MNILVTGAKGMVATVLVANLKIVPDQRGTSLPGSMYSYQY